MENQVPTNDQNSTTYNAPQSGGPKKDNKSIIIGIAVILLLATWAYLIYNKYQGKGEMNALSTQTATNDSARAAIEAEYNDALLKMDSLVGSNVQMKGDLADKQKEIDQLKLRVRDELRSDQGDLVKARSLISQLKSKINGLLDEVNQLRAENKLLYADNEDLRNQRDTLTSKNTRLSGDLQKSTAENQRITEVASTLHASNFNITALDVNKSGKEKATEKAKKADLLRISFDIDANRITASGGKTLYMVLTNPSGQVVTIPSAGSGTFTTKESGVKTFTSQLPIHYIQGKTIPVTFDWRQDGKYQIGTYHISIYENGYLIGSGEKTLKKSGFLGL